MKEIDFHAKVSVNLAYRMLISSQQHKTENICLKVKKNGELRPIPAVDLGISKLLTIFKRYQIRFVSDNNRNRRN